MDQKNLSLTGLAGAGKTTAIKAAEQFYHEFYSLCNIMWTDTTNFYTVYTGSGVYVFGGQTIVKASGMCTTNVTQNQ